MLENSTALPTVAVMAKPMAAAKNPAVDSRLDGPARINPLRAKRFILPQYCNLCVAQM
jgi:hypothetical protein